MTRPAWALDLDGVIRLGSEAIPGAAEAVRLLQDRGDPVVFVTNASYDTEAQVEAQLDGLDIDANGAVVTSAMAAATLVEPGESVLAYGGPGVIEALEHRGVTFCPPNAQPDVVVVGIHRDITYDSITRAAHAIRTGARFVATNMDATFPTAEGLLPGCGALVAAIAAAAGVTPVVAGKPEPSIADLVRSIVGPVGVMVGDRPDTDGLFAAALGYEFALVLSGVTSAADLPVDPPPSVIEADLLGVVRRSLA